MIKFYRLDFKTKTSTLEPLTDSDDINLMDGFSYSSEYPTVNSVQFKIKHGKKFTDVISYSDNILFFSQKFIDFLSNYIKVENCCYPINIEGAAEQYFCLYRLKSFSHFNKYEHDYYGEPILFEDEGLKLPLLFTITEHPMLIVNEEFALDIEMQDFKNVDLQGRVYSYSRYEVEGWQKYWAIQKTRSNGGL